MNNIIITIKKELRSIFRDKKTIMTMLLFPIIIPAMVMLYGNMYDSIENETEEYNILINYDINDEANSILDSLNINYEIENDVEEIKDKYKNGEYDGYIIYTNDNNTYTIYTNTSSTSGMTANAIIHNYLEQYSSYLTNIYLVNHEIDLEEAYNHFNISDEELGNNNYMLQIVLSVCFTYIIMAICMATSNMAIATTAQEKENGTLETILTFPIKKTELIIGKYLSSAIVGFLASLVGLILMIISLTIAKKQFTMFEGYSLLLNFKTISISLLVIICASLLISGAALALTSKTKSFKEAQSQISLLNMICVVPLFVSILEISLTSVYFLIPVCNFEQTLMDLFSNNINYMNLAITLGSTVVYCIIVISYIINAYNEEKVLFTN